MNQLGHALYELLNWATLSGWPGTIIRRVISVSSPPWAVSTCFFVPGGSLVSTWYTSGGGGTRLLIAGPSSFTCPARILAAHAKAAPGKPKRGLHYTCFPLRPSGRRGW